MCDDFVLTMSENVNKQSISKPRVVKSGKSKVKLSDKRCPYTIDWVDESNNESNHLITSSNDLTTADK